MVCKPFCRHPGQIAKRRRLAYLEVLVYILWEKQQSTGSDTHDLLPTRKSCFSFCHIDTFIFVPVSMCIDVRRCGKYILCEMNGMPSLFLDCLDNPQSAKIPADIWR